MMVEATASMLSVLAIAEPRNPSIRATGLPGSRAAPDVNMDGLAKSERVDHRVRPSFRIAEIGLKASSLEENDRVLSDRDDASPPELENPSLRVRFKSSPDSGRVAISVIDATTEEIIREIPSEELQEISKKIKADIGLLFDRNG